MHEYTANGEHSPGVPTSQRDALIRNVPEAMKTLDRWVCHRDKVPRNPLTGSMASVTNPATWTDFETALDAVQEYGFDGIGLVFANDKDFTGVDLDHVLDENGKLLEEYEWIVRDADTYTEISPSGEGLHLIFEGPKPEGVEACRHQQEDGCVVEVYDAARYFTMTGNLFIDSNGNSHAEVRSGGSALREICSRCLHSPIRDKSPNEPLDALPSLHLEDDEVLRRMFSGEDGIRAEALFAGDTSGKGGDDSRADFDLCKRLARFCGEDRAQIDRIFRRSGLMRPKWDDPRPGGTYGSNTIENALRLLARERAGKPDAEPSSDRSPWIVDEHGDLYKRGRGEGREFVTSTPPHIEAVVRDIEGGESRMLLGFKNGLQVTLERNVALDSRKIVDAQAPLGVNVSSVIARDVVAYITFQDGRQAEDIPVVDSATSLGWAGKPLSAFMPFDDGKHVGDGPAVRCDPRDDMRSRLASFAESRGTLDAWVAKITPLREKNMALRTMLAASFASVLVRLLCVQQLLLYVWGESRSGKTAALKAAASVWGNPSTGPDAYVRSFNDTDKSLIRFATFLHDLPIFIDELQSRDVRGGQQDRRNSVKGLLYQLCQGQERAALNANRTLMRNGSWRSITLATGEVPVLGHDTLGGAVNRTIELNAEPFDDPRKASDLHVFCSENFGTAGRAFVRGLRETGLETIRGLWESVKGAVTEIADGHPQAGNIALLALADELSGRHVFSGPSMPDGSGAVGPLELARWLIASTKDATESDPEIGAIFYIDEWIERNRRHLTSTPRGAGGPGDVEPFGFIKKGRCNIFSDAFREAVTAAGYDRDKVVRRLDREGILVRGSRGFTRQPRLFGDRHRCVTLDLGKLDEFKARVDEVDDDTHTFKPYVEGETGIETE